MNMKIDKKNDNVSMINLGEDCLCSASLPPKDEEFVGIYVFYNSKYFYVGQSVHVRSRIKEHKRSLSKGRHENIVAQRVYNKYKDSDPFKYKPLLSCDPNDLDYFEDYCFNKIKEANPNKTAMNIAKCGESGNTALSRINKSKAFKGRQYPTKWVKYVQLDLDGNLIKIWDSITEAKKHFDVEIKTDKISSGGFQWQKYEDWLVNPKGKAEYKHQIHKTIKQFDLDGNFIREWDSIKEAEDNIKEASSICSCLSGKNKTSGGYLWSYTYDPPKVKINKSRCGPKKAVGQYDLNNNLIKVFKTVNAAATETGLTAYEIKRNIDNKTSNAGGYIWKYQN